MAGKSPKGSPAKKSLAGSRLTKKQKAKFFDSLVSAMEARSGGSETE